MAYFPIARFRASTLFCSGQARAGVQKIKKTPREMLDSSRNVNYHRCFVTFSTSGGPGSCKTGPTSNPGEGKIRLVIESTSFSSQTGPQTPHQTPPDPQTRPPGVLEIICIFFQKKKVPLVPTGANFLAVSRSRFAGAGDGSRWLTVVY